MPASGIDAIRAENARRGTPGWRIQRRARPHALDGWADHVSVLPGGRVALYISTTEHGFRVSAFRMGWYGGTEARLVYRSGRLAGRRQAAFRVQPSTRTVITRWQPTLVVTTRGWVPGDYLFRLDGDSGAQSYIPLTVRSPDTAGRLIIMNAVTTWQAYNGWGGYNLYHGPAGTGLAGRSRAVSFDRPYDGAGDGRFLAYEQPLVALAERLNLPVAYLTDVDLHEHPDLLDKARGLVSLGHDEYWSSRMRQAVLAARDHGVNIAFLGANAVFQHVRLGPTVYGPDRLVICYKSARGDPLRGRNNAELTVPWRWATPPRPERELTGEMYESNPVDASLVVYDPNSWLLRGLGYRAGSSIPHLVQGEYDRADPAGPLLGPIDVIAHSPVVCRGVHSYADAAYASTSTGAGVFDAGTTAWVAGLRSNNPVVRRFVTPVTTRLLTAFAAGPTGRAHPARANLAGLHAYSGDPIAARRNLW